MAGYTPETWGFLDVDGYLTVVDRKKDMIISGGENVYSTQVEDVIYRHPDVLECAVFGTPHEKWGESVHAIVVAKIGSALGRAERNNSLPRPPCWLQMPA